MPLNKTGKKVLRNFEREYGEKGKGYFYAKENKSKSFAHAMTGAIHSKLKKAGKKDYEMEEETKHHK